jgi:hypothetical protein
MEKGEHLIETPSLRFKKSIQKPKSENSQDCAQKLFVSEFGFRVEETLFFPKISQVEAGRGMGPSHITYLCVYYYTVLQKASNSS